MINDIPVQDSLVLAIVPSGRSLLDHSPGRRTVQIAGSGLKWVRRGGVDQLLAEGTGRLVVPNDTELQAVTDFSLFVAGNLSNNATRRHVLAKRDGGGTQINVRLNAASIEIWDGAVTSAINVGNFVAFSSVAVCGNSGEKFDAFGNGVPIGTLSAMSTIVPSTSDISLLNYYTGVGPSLDPYRVLLLYSRVLTAQENSELHAWSESLASPLVPADRRYFDMGSNVPNGNANGEVASFDLGVVTSGEIADKSGNGNHGSVVGACMPVWTEAGRALSFDGVTGHVEVTGVASTAKSYSVSVTAKGSDLGAIQYIFTCQTDFFGVAFESDAFGKIGFHDGAWRHYGPGSFDAWHRFVFVFDGVAAKSRLYVDGEQSGVEVDYTPIDIGGQARIGMHPSAALFPFGGAASDLVIVDRVLSLAEIKADYNKLARRVMYSEDFSLVAPTVTPVTSGSIRGTGYTVESGAFSIVEDPADGEKYLECVTAGFFWRKNQQAYGTWELCAYKQDASTNRLHFVQSELSISAGSAYLHFLGNTELIALTERGVGTMFVTAAGVLAVATKQTLTMTRSAAGAFVVYLEGTQIGTGNDTTITTSKYCAYDLDAGDRIYLDRQFLGVCKP